MSKANDLTKAIVNTLNACGFKAWRNNSTGVYDPIKKVFRSNACQLKGVPDVLAIIPTTGRFLGVEVKIGKDKLSIHQELFMEEANRKGALSLVATDYDQFITALIHGLESDEMYLVDCLLRGYVDKPTTAKRKVA